MHIPTPVVNKRMIMSSKHSPTLRVTSEVMYDCMSYSSAVEGSCTPT